MTRTDANEVHVEARIDQTPSQCTRYEVVVTNRFGHISAKTQCTPCEGESSDCPEDFRVNIVLRVPKGARVQVSTDAAAKI